jgi:hypothetical protein
MNPPDILGKKVIFVTVGDWDGAKASSLFIEFDDGTQIHVHERYEETLGWVNFNLVSVKTIKKVPRGVGEGMLGLE